MKNNWLIGSQPILPPTRGGGEGATHSDWCHSLVTAKLPWQRGLGHAVLQLVGYHPRPAVKGGGVSKRSGRAARLADDDITDAKPEQQRKRDPRLLSCHLLPPTEPGSVGTPMRVLRLPVCVRFNSRLSFTCSCGAVGKANHLVKPIYFKTHEQGKRTKHKMLPNGCGVSSKLDLRNNIILFVSADNEIWYVQVIRKQVNTQQDNAAAD